MDISDTLALSIETRGFTLGKSKYTVYKKEVVNIVDVFYLIGFAIGIALCLTL